MHNIDIPILPGQLVYTTIGQRKYPKEWRVAGIWLSETEEANHFIAYHYDGNAIDCSRSYYFSDIGNTVFLTKEEAEKKLKGEKSREY